MPNPKKKPDIKQQQKEPETPKPENKPDEIKKKRSFDLLPVD